MRLCVHPKRTRRGHRQFQKQAYDHLPTDCRGNRVKLQSSAQTGGMAHDWEEMSHAIMLSWSLFSWTLPSAYGDREHGSLITALSSSTYSCKPRSDFCFARWSMLNAFGPVLVDITLDTSQANHLFLSRPSVTPGGPGCSSVSRYTYYYRISFALSFLYSVSPITASFHWQRPRGLRKR